MVIGVARTQLTDQMKIRAVAAVGAGETADDDLPQTPPVAIDLLAARPALGLREIDTSRNNLQLDEHQPTLREGAAPRVVESGRGSTAMILVPGVYSGAGAFDGFVARNSERYVFFTITPPGLDGTPPRRMPPASASYGDLPWTRALASDIRALIERKHLSRPIVVAHGFPGSIAAEELAMNDADVLGGIVEIAAMAVQPLPSQTSPGREITPEERAALVDDSWARQWFKYVTPETWENNNYPAEMFANNPVTAERVRRQVEANSLQVKIRYLAEFMASDRRRVFSRLIVSVLIVKPGFSERFFEDPRFGWMKGSFQEGWKTYPGNSHVEQMTIAGARALLLDDEPALADRAVAEFVERARGRTL
jgi:pimeloyl-ACP methyl ester carboxylesterase